jgi:membrane protein DedA with SNARE-associated domain
MELLPTLGLLVLLLVKEAGVPIPVPGDLLVLGAGVAAAAAGPASLVLLVPILIAGFVGGSIQFVLVRGTFRRPLLRVLARFGVPEAKVERLAAWLRRRGTAGVALARATPGLRVGAIAASALAALPFGSFVAGLVAGNSMFVGGHFALGFLVGAPALAAVSAAGGLAVGVVVFVALAALGGAGWLAIRRRRNGAPTSGDGEPGGAATGASIASWTEAACPACLAIALVARPAAAERAASPSFDPRGP